MIARLLLLLGLVRGALRGARGVPEPQDDVDPSRYDLVATRGSELGLVALLGLATVFLLAFAVLVAAHPNTQLLGLTGGGGLVLLAAALVLAGLRVVPQETAVEPRPGLTDPEAERELEEDLRSGADGVSRRKLIAGAAGAAGTGLAAAAALPLTAIGPSPGHLGEAPWKAGTPLVDEEDKPVLADDLEVGAFLTAFPEGADKRELGSPVVVVRIDPATLRLPAARRGWAPEGLMAYSRICTHAGCAVSLFRHPKYEPQSSGPALACPCHYSTFDVRRGGLVVFGPAGRPLPQLPLRVGEGRRLVAAGPMSDAIGPAWWGVPQ